MPLTIFDCGYEQIDDIVTGQSNNDSCCYLQWRSAF